MSEEEDDLDRSDGAIFDEEALEDIPERYD